ncbi:MoaD/ThiS family protein [Alteromonas sp. D210916BOD_24]|uniref:MoaD/ThiS family protein n=1 Tax=Alteromonas sp. D210916BOD_24 TaxID=3157618 RepID=UPI00399C6061
MNNPLQITVKTFAQTRELAGETDVTVTLDEGATIAMLISVLRARSPGWNLALTPSVLTARNQQLCSKDTPIKDSDEIALFPPVTGG